MSHRTFRNLLDLLLEARSRLQDLSSRQKGPLQTKLWKIEDLIKQIEDLVAALWDGASLGERDQ